MTEVSRSIKLSAPVEKVWARVGPFAALAEWHPAIEGCEVEGAGVGAVRTLRVAGGAIVMERLEAQDDATHTATYTALEMPMPVSDYRSTMQVVAAGDAECTFTWSGTFEPEGVPEEMAVQMIGGIYDAGMDALRKLFGA